MVMLQQLQSTQNEATSESGSFSELHFLLHISNLGVVSASNETNEQQVVEMWMFSVAYNYDRFKRCQLILADNETVLVWFSTKLKEEVFCFAIF